MTIIRNPVGFLRNLVGAVGQGVRQFMNNILRHLRDGVIAWLTGPVARAGIQMPERWDLRGIIWFVLQILGLTWDRIRQKLVRLMGERAVGMLEAGFQLIQDIRQRGFVQALRDRVTEFFGQLREAALGSIRSFIQQRLVMAGITQLLSLLSPVGAVIQAIIKTYNTIQFFIQRINQILDLVESIVNSVSAIASGALGQAANFVERTMARTIPVILDFLARFIGLGDVGGQVQRTIQGLQARVDQMLDRAVDWIRTQAQRLVAAGRSAVRRVIDWWRVRKQFTGADRQPHTISVDRRGNRAVIIVQTTPRTLDVIINEQDEPLRSQLAAKYRDVQGLFGGTEPNEAQSEARHRDVETKIDEIVGILRRANPSGPGALPPARPTVVTHTLKSGNRAHRIIADPLTSAQGNTRRGAAESEILERSFFWAFVQPEPQTRTVRGKKIHLESLSMIRGTHLLSHNLFGPTDRWNIANASPSINERMKAPEDKAGELTAAGHELRYTTTVEYGTEAPPPPSAAEAFIRVGNEANEERKKAMIYGWLGFYFARSYSVSLSIIKSPPGVTPPPVPNYPPYTSNIRDSLRLRGEVNDIKGKVMARIIATAGSGGRVAPYKQLARLEQMNNDEMLDILVQLKNEGRLRKQGRFYYINAQPVVDTENDG
jgi:hypothetical protein